jgi:uncharacterized protein (DUF58 family)
VRTFFAGAYHSAFKGKGLTFEEVREYMAGDEIRDIDWKVTARMNYPFVKTFQEERELTVLLIVDISASTHFGSSEQLKSEAIAEIGAVLAFSAIKNQDKVGLLLFSDKVELYLKPKKGTRHVLRVIRELLLFKAQDTKTNMQKALSFLGQVQRQRTLCFLISDFLIPSFEETLHAVNVLSKRHEMIALQIEDRYEREFPNLGVLHLRDLELDQVGWIDTDELELQERFKEETAQVRLGLKQSFERIGMAFLSLDCSQNYLEDLRQFFKRRERKP